MKTNLEEGKDNKEIKDNKEVKDNKKLEEGNEGKEGIDVEEGDGAIQHLIFHSFYPLTCMVPLGEDFITIKESAPELMKARETDSLLQETIKTFQGLMQEKDDEILNLRRQVKDENSTLVKMTSVNIQTDLTLSDCAEMEQQLEKLSVGLPDKVEKIHQLQKEKIKLQESFYEIENDKSKITHLEEELNESLKNLLELEENNIAIAKANANLKQNCQELNWKLEEMNDLKVEVEVAKIQTEDDMLKLKDSLRDKDSLITRLNDQLKNNEEFYGMNETSQLMNVKEKMSNNMINNQGNELKEIKDNMEINETTPKESELNDLIEKVKEKILYPPSQEILTATLIETLPKYAERFGSSDIESIKELLIISSENGTSKNDLKSIVTILEAIEFKESGEINKNLLINGINSKNKQDKKNIKTKEELQDETLQIGIMVLTKEALFNSDKTFIKSEYMKLEVILNTLNRSYKTTNMSALNNLSNKEITEKILKIKKIIFSICMHAFWENIFDQPIKEMDICTGFPIDSTDRIIIGTLIFPYFIKENDFRIYLDKLVNIREILLVGEQSENKIKPSDILLMKMFGINVQHDICNHILPMFPKEVRYVLFGKPSEDLIFKENKVLEKISKEFLCLLEDLEGNNSSNMSTIIFDIFLTLNFEDELFTLSSKNLSTDFKIWKLSTSSSTKVENTIVRVSLYKNKKQFILSKIQAIQYFINGTKEKDVSETYKLKSESELIKILIDIKENLLKIMFLDSFHPIVDKLLLNKDAVYLSCLSKERVGVDYWIQMLLNKYYKNMLQNLNELTLEEMEISLNRLNQALKIILPSYISREDVPKSKFILASMISNQRNTLKKHICQFIYRKSSKLQLTQNMEEMLRRDQIYDLPIQKDYQTLKEMFSIPQIDKIKLENILHRLYDIDCEIYPGNFTQDMEKKKFSSISDVEIFEEILILRLSIAAYVILPYEYTSIKENFNNDNRKNHKTLKEMENILLQIDDGILNDNVISAEAKHLKVIIENLKKKNKIDNEKLHSSFLSLKKIECGLYNTMFDSSKVSNEFNKGKDNKEKKLLVIREAETLFDALKLNLTSKQNKTNISENYIKIEELLEDIESKMTTEEVQTKAIWAYSVYNKTEEILNLTVERHPTKNNDKLLIRDHVLNNLEDIKIWTAEESNWRKNCFNRLNNLIKTLNTKVKNRKIEMSISDNSEFSGNFEDEKVAFEKAFTQLENRFIDLTSTNEKIKTKTNVIDLTKKTDEELRNIILALEKEMDNANWTKSDENDAKAWLNSRVRDDLLIDCNNLLQKSLMMKIDGMLTNVNRKENKAERPFRENQITQFEDDINEKLAKYEELCNTVEKLKIPQHQVIRKMHSSNNLLEPENLCQSNNNSFTYAKPLTYRSSIRSYSNQTPLPQLDDDDIDLYFQKRMEELQRFIKFPNNSVGRDKASSFRKYGQNGTDILVDGFDIEEEKTPRYYSMKLQDIQHERKEDEMGALLHHIEKHRMNLLAENQNFQQQLYISNGIQENQNERLLNLEKTEDILRQKLASLGSDNLSQSQKIINSEEIQIMKHERQRLKSSLSNFQKKIDELNNENISLSSSNVNFQQENHGLTIKNQYLERTINKLETMYEDLIQELEYCKNRAEKSNQDNSPNITDVQDYPTSDRDMDQKLRMNEKDKIELVKKLDIIEQQNKLLKKHCEKMKEEISNLTSKLTETKNKSEAYFRQNQQFAEVLDKMKVEKKIFETPSTINSLRNKEEEIKQLKNKILHLETRLISVNEVPSGERLKQELISNKDKEITRLIDQLGSLQDRIDEMRAQSEVKDYENKKLLSLSKQLQNQINDKAYYPPPGYKIVKDN